MTLRGLPRRSAVACRQTAGKAPSDSALPAAPASVAPPSERALDRLVLTRAAPCAARAGASLLADAASLSRTHDAFGLLQLPPDGVPGLADVAADLLRAAALARHCAAVRSLANRC